MQVMRLPTPIARPLPQAEGEREWRRGACPGLSAPMQTGDGLLVRLLPIGTIALDAFASLCAAAREHGNGVIEVTARGSIQVRGLTAASAMRFADAVGALNFAVADGIPVLSDTLAGLDPEEIFDGGALAAELRQALTRTSIAARLAPKVSVVIDGGGRLSLDALDADVRLRAESADGGAVLGVSVGGNGATATKIGVVAPAHGVEAGVRSLEVIARRGCSTRARDMLAVEGIGQFRAALSHLLLPAALPRKDADPSPPFPPALAGVCGRLRGNEQRTDPIGRHRLRGGSLACGIGLAFGHAGAAALQKVADAAGAAGAVGIRAAAGRALLVVGLAQETAPGFVAAAKKLGFIVEADDPRRQVVACAGAPMCSSAHIPARRIAPRAAELVAPRLDGSLQIHISGCAKSCAQAGAAPLTIVGLPDGCAIIANGSARDAPVTIVAPDELLPTIAKFTRAAKPEGDHA